jgi:copper homeostasis protein
MTLLEVCLDDIEGALIAQGCGADHIELCAGLGEGGTTPSLGTVATVLDTIDDIDVRVLIRQRPGDFVFSEGEVRAMCADIEAIRALETSPGVQVGFALGALLPNGEIDQVTTTRMLRTCGST